MALDELQVAKIDENDWKYDLYQPEVKEETEQEQQQKAAEQEQIDAKAKADQEAVAAAEVETQRLADEEAAKKQEEAKVETKTEAVVSKKYVPIENEKDLWEKLSKKYNHESLKPEDKALQFIKQQNPELNDDELLFVAASDYGIGVERPTESDLTEPQLLELKKQDIARKKLFTQADNFFKEQANGVVIDGEDPLDLDPQYKTYREQTTQAEQARKEQQQLYEQTLQQITSASKKISDLKIPVEIDIDDSKLAIDVNFKLDEKKQKELVSYAERYSPSKEEVAQFTDTSTGKFDFDGYLASLAKGVFSQDIIKAGIRQALAQDRERFIEKELKNSTLRNNDVSKTVDTKVDFNDTYWDKYAGR